MLDESIIELYNDRSEEAIAETIKKYGRLCHTVAYNVLRDEEDAKECVNDTYLHAWNSIPPAHPNSFSSFLCRIARNLALDRYRRKSASSRSNGQTELIFEELGECISGSDSTEQVIDSIIQRDVINSFLDSLNPESRDIFVCRYFYMYSTAQIAKAYRISESKVRTSLCRARNKLKTILEREI